MIHYQLFYEFCNACIWGSSLADAITRAKKLPHRQLKNRVDDAHGTHHVLGCQEPIVIAKVLGMRETKGETRESKPFQCALVETEDGSIIEVDAVESGSSF